MLFWFSCWTKRGMRWIIALSNQRSFSPNRYYEQLWGMVWLLFNRCPLSNERAMAALKSLQTPAWKSRDTNASTVLMWCRNQEITNKRFSIPDKQSIHLQREVPSLPIQSRPHHISALLYCIDSSEILHPTDLENTFHGSIQHQRNAMANSPHST